MTEAEEASYAGYKLAVGQATNLVAQFPESAPSPVTNEFVEQVSKSLGGQVYTNLEDSTLKSAIDTANLAYFNAIKGALNTSISDNNTAIDNLETTIPE